MIALLCLFLTVFVSPFKSKRRLEAENAALRYQLSVLRRKVRHERGSLVLSPAVSLVSIGPEDHHDHPARDPRALASGRLSPVLALEVQFPWRSAKDRC